MTNDILIPLADVGFLLILFLTAFLISRGIAFAIDTFRRSYLGKNESDGSSTSANSRAPARALAPTRSVP